MKPALPTAEQLEKLPMRAVVAYVARTVRRVSPELRGIVADEILDNALRLVDAVWTGVGEVDHVSVIDAAKRVVDAYAAAPPITKSPDNCLVVFSFIHAALVAMYAVEAGVDPSNRPYHMRTAVEEAQRAVSAIKVLGKRAANAAMEAARWDYDVLLRKYGEHDQVVIGDPVDCFENEKRGEGKPGEGRGERGTS